MTTATNAANKPAPKRDRREYFKNRREKEKLKKAEATDKETAKKAAKKQYDAARYLRNKRSSKAMSSFGGFHQGTTQGDIPGVKRNQNRREKEKLKKAEATDKETAKKAANAARYLRNKRSSKAMSSFGGFHQGTTPGDIPGVKRNLFAGAPANQQNTFARPRPLSATPAQIHCHVAALHSEASAQRMACKLQNGKIDGDLL